MQAKRETELDVLRLLAILAVIMIHAGLGVLVSVLCRKTEPTAAIVAVTRNTVS